MAMTMIAATTPIQGAPSAADVVVEVEVVVGVVVEVVEVGDAVVVVVGVVVEVVEVGDAVVVVVGVVVEVVEGAMMIVLASNVTAVCASALPFNVAPVFIAISV